MNPVAKFQKWIVTVNGVQTPIAVLASGVPDNLNGAGGYQGTYNNAKSYAQGAIVRVESVQTFGGATTAIGVYGCVLPVPANGTGHQVPQWPEPSGNAYWHLLNFGPKVVSVCQNGTKTIYVNSSDPF